MFSAPLHSDWKPCRHRSHLLHAVLYLSLQAMESFADEDAGTSRPSVADAGTAEADLDDFGMSGWGQFEVEDAEPEPEPEQQPRKQAKRGKAAAAKVGRLTASTGVELRLWEQGNCAATPFQLSKLHAAQGRLAR